jgi:hypothetical protein
MLGIVGLLVWFLICERSLERRRDPAELVIELGDLAAQLRDVAAGGQVDEMPEAPAARFDAAADARLGARGQADRLGEGRAPRRLLEMRRDGLLGGVEDLPQQWFAS